MQKRPWFKTGVWPGVPKSMRYPEIPLFELLSNVAKKAPNETAIIFLGKRIKWIELEALSDSFSNALLSLGVRKGDRISLILPNCPQFVISYYGILKAGGIVVAINPLLKEDEIEYVLNDSGAKIAVTLDPKLIHPKIKNSWTKRG